MNIKQRKILRKLVIQNGLRYSELYDGFEYEDKFPYHLKQLVKNGFVNKREGKYFLTKTGMKKTAYFNTRTLEEEQLKIPRINFICNYKGLYKLVVMFEKDNSRSTYYSLPGGNAVVGENLEYTCRQVLKDKYGVSGIIRYRSTHHHTCCTTDGDILFDDILLIYDVDVQQVPSDMKNWFTADSISELKNRSPLIDQYILENNREAFYESSSISNIGIEINDLK